jgi:2'-5' RNA ligase
MNVRLFIAIETTGQTQKNVKMLQDKLKKSDADVTWVAPENLHITLKFIGYIDEEKTGSIVTIIKESVTHIKPFNLSYVGTGILPTEKDPRVIFVHAEENGNILSTIHERLDNQFMALGVEHETRKFKAHLTIGRIKTRRNVKKLIEGIHSYNEFNFGTELITQVVLMKSDLFGNGPVYTKLHGIDLL